MLVALATQLFQNAPPLFLVLSPRQHVKKLLQNMGAGLLALIAPIVGCVVIAIGLNALDRTMSWFARPIWIFVLYIVPSYLVSAGLIYLHAKYRHKVSTERLKIA